MLNPGDVLENKYHIDQLISRGAFGRVWKAYDGILERDVAIKELIEVKQDQLESFITEMKTLARLECERTVKIYQAIPTESTFYLVMEYCPLGSLRNLLKTEGKLPVEEAVKYAIEVCGGLSVVHENHIVHHDIKPSNILIGNDGHIKISDFGVANTRLGTFHYLAPDQFNRNSDPHDPRTDIYALGITLYEMLIGEVPFKGNEAQIMNGHIYDQPAFPTYLPDWLKNIILKATAKEPDLRFQTVNDFMGALEARRAPSIMKPEMLRASVWNAEAEKLLKKRQWRKAITYLEESLKLYPEYSLAHANIGSCFQHLGLMDKALSHLETGKYHSTPLVIKSLASLHLDRQEYSKAISILSDYTYKNPLDYEAHNLLGKAFFEVGYYDRAIELYDALLTAKRLNTVFSNNLMLAYFMSGMDDKVSRILKYRYINDDGYKYLQYNVAIMSERPSGWNTDIRESSKIKLLFAPYFESGTKRRQDSDSSYVKLEVLSDNRSFGSSERIVSIGRLKTNLFVFEEGNISRRHCVIVREEDNWLLVDLGSSGTYIDGKRVSRTYLFPGVESMVIADTECRLILT